ncbi:MAG TPA: DUF6600 domain-containing protein [Thermoanaerobaculia bacterium]|nr:DUF6600 domain-containing protein [Thermoanaerobaculia bacterium]
MRRSTILITASILAVALPLAADDKHQSYVTYDSGGSIVVQQFDGREVEARANLPIFPGDEFRTTRRGRAEVRLADGNVMALSRDTAVRFQSILDSYEGEGESTVAQLLGGQVMVHRLSSSNTPLRLDTETASYASTRDASYSVETLNRGQDVITVYRGSVEVRTPSRVARLRAGERGTIDGDGVHGTTQAGGAMGDFEDWSMRRADRYMGRSSRYLDARLAYAEDDLASYGSWVYASDYGSHVWRPRVSYGWRPYYYGSWISSPSGALVWVSDEPWGWAPYHYGRWAWSSRYGWVWIPGGGYAPAWVYWAFGPTYVGWVPAGWFDCYRPYYPWLYRPHVRGGISIGFGFYGRVRLGNVDLQPWTFVTPGVLVSRRVDRAALTTDDIKRRLVRDGDGAAIAKGSVRFGRDELRDPHAAVREISRRGIGGGTGKEGSGTTSDLTPFFRRDPELSPAVRDHVARLSRPADGGDGVRTRITTGGGESGRIIRGADGSGRDASRVVPRAGTGGTEGGTASPSGTIGRRPASGSDSPATQTPGRAIGREREGSSTSGATPRTPGSVQRSDEGDWRRLERPRTEGEVSAPRTVPRQQSSGDREWRRGTVPRDSAAPAPAAAGGSSRIAAPRSSGEERVTPRDVSRRIIDQIGGPRVSPASPGAKPSTKEAPPSSRSAQPRIESRPRQEAPKQREAPKQESKPSQGSERRSIKRD